MYYIIENKEQLTKFSEYDFTNCYVDVIMMNDNWHPSLSKPSLIYIRPFKSRAGFILAIDHSETFKLPIEDVMSLLRNKIGQIYAVDAKRLRYLLDRETGVFCLKTAKYLHSGEILDESAYNTAAHRFFTDKYECKDDINRIIPVAKHYEKLENIINDYKFNHSWFKPKYYKLYGSMAINVFKKIESSGIKIDSTTFNQHFKTKCDPISIKSDVIYTHYNIYTATGRPSNAFNGINFGALKKNDGSRASFVAKNDVLVEFDYSSYHLRILTNLIGYEFEEKDIHTHLGKFYFEKNELSEEEYAESKSLTFKLLYTESASEEVKNIPFFKMVRDFKNDLWEKYKKTGYIESFISKRPIRNIESKTQILPYILQNYETERNVMVLNELINFLNDKKTKIILYNYDSFLLDLHKKDGKNILEDVSSILEQGGYHTSVSYGKNYNNMKKI